MLLSRKNKLETITSSRTNAQTEINHCAQREELLSQRTGTTSTASQTAIDENNRYDAQDIDDFNLNLTISDIDSDVDMFD